MTHPTPRMTQDAWATAQIQQAMPILISEINSDWFEDRSAEHREWLVKAILRHLDEALSHRRFAHFMRRGGNVGLFKRWMRDAIREAKTAKKYAKELEL